MERYTEDKKTTTHCLIHFSQTANFDVRTEDLRRAIFLKRARTERTCALDFNARNFEIFSGQFCAHMVNADRFSCPF